MPYTDFAKDVCDAPDATEEERKKGCWNFWQCLLMLKLLTNDPGEKYLHGITTLMMPKISRYANHDVVQRVSFLCGTKVRDY